LRKQIITLRFYIIIVSLLLQCVIINNLSILQFVLYMFVSYVSCLFVICVCILCCFCTWPSGYWLGILINMNWFALTYYYCYYYYTVSICMAVVAHISVFWVVALCHLAR